MSVSILSRPDPIVVSETGVAAVIVNGALIAQVNSPLHGLVNERVYIKSRVENYNGFFTIFVPDANYFYLIDPADGFSYIQWVKDANITYYKETEEHDFLAAHNPIVYSIKSTLWPTNSVDSIRQISGSGSPVNGYTNISISASLGTFETLDYVKIEGLGVFQIVDKASTTNITIDRAYDVSLNGLNIQLYKNNYCVNVYVSTGQALPLDTVATLRLIPDSNNIVKFSVHEVVKAFIKQRNNLLLAGLPNNTDFWTFFYIVFAEQYDVSDGTNIAAQQQGLVDDSANRRTAVNAKLAFKNKYSGDMSEYLNKFLTVFAIPVMFAGCSDIDDCYYDVSFIKKTGAISYLKQDWYLGGVLQDITYKTVPASGVGVYRVQPDQRCQYDRVDLSITDGPLFAMTTLDTFSNEAGPNTNWSFAGGLFTALSVPAGETTDNLSSPILIGVAAGNYNVTITATASGTGTSTNIQFFKAGVLITNHSFSTPTSGSTSFSISLPSDVDQIKIKELNPSGSSRTFFISSSTFSIEGTGETIIQPKQVDITCDCFDGVRLTWLNNLGGFEYWSFNAFKDNMLSIGETGETSVNILPDWPNSYGEFADTDKRRQTFRESTRQIRVNSQNITKEQVDGIATIKSSTLVQIINSVYDKRTVIVDKDSFTLYNDNDKSFKVSFTITYTDDIPAQTV